MVDSDFTKGNEQALGFAATEARDNEEIIFVKGALKSRKWKRGNAWSREGPQYHQPRRSGL